MTEWEMIIQYLKNLPSSGKTVIGEAMKNAPGNVKYRTKKGVKFWEYAFIKYGYECFIQFQTGGRDDVYRIMAFNNEDNTSYLREPLLEGLNDNVQNTP